MKKIIVFAADYPSTAARKVNQWQEENPKVNVISSETRIADNRDTIVSIIYEEDKEAELLP